MGKAALVKEGKENKYRRKEKGKVTVRILKSPTIYLKVPILYVRRCVYMCVCAMRERVNEIFPSGLTMLPLRTIDHLTKAPTPSKKSCLFSYGSGLLSKRLPKHVTG